MRAMLLLVLAALAAVAPAPAAAHGHHHHHHHGHGRRLAGAGDAPVERCHDRSPVGAERDLFERQLQRFVNARAAGASIADARAAAGIGLPPAAGNASAGGGAARRLQQTGTITIPTWVHIIIASDGVTGNVSDSAVDSQIAAMNDAFLKISQTSGYSYSGTGAADRFQFSLAGITRTVNGQWFAGMCPGTNNEINAKKALRRGGTNTLNIYTSQCCRGKYLGYSNFPSSAGSVTDGVAIHYGSMPGGGIANYNMGLTAAHETGHWMGLYHTFQGNSCSTSNANDQVGDTWQQASATSGCPTNRDSCTGLTGKDPVENYMDYSYDVCYARWTQLQSDRMVNSWNAYRKVV